LQGGRLIEIGPAEQICGRPEQAYTKSLIAAALDPFGESRAGVIKGSSLRGRFASP
jgi:ABC-type dipeptide/oligopeptide/nickel transport system ATPase component